jgi:hypothetical protein
MDFTSCRENTQKVLESFHEKTPGKFWMLTVMPLVCTKLLRKKSCLAMRSSGMGGGAAGEIPVTSLVGSAREWLGRG